MSQNKYRIVSNGKRFSFQKERQFLWWRWWVNIWFDRWDFSGGFNWFPGGEPGIDFYSFEDAEWMLKICFNSSGTVEWKPIREAAT